MKFVVQVRKGGSAKVFKRDPESVKVHYSDASKISRASSDGKTELRRLASP